MKKLILTLIVISAFGFSEPIEEKDAFKPVIVLELFTSQGCSSCPSADNLLNKVRKNYQEEEVYALSYHVTYWDYIGWKDPFGKESYTAKQRKYAQKFRSRSVYTPQLVVNGREHFVGSNNGKLLSKIKSYSQSSTPNEVTLKDVNRNGSNVSLSYQAKGNLNGKKLRTVLVIEERETQVKRGENRNRRLVNSNIVVAEKYMVPSAEGQMTIDIPSIVNTNDQLHVMVLVEGDDLTITAADKVAL